jgi:hypothetical protein
MSTGNALPPTDIRKLLAGKRFEPKTAKQWAQAEAGAAACDQDYPGGNTRYGDALIGTDRYWRAAYELRYHEILDAKAQPPAATEFPSLEAFYDDRPERRRSGEADFGVHWHADGKRWPEWRVSYVQATGEVIAVEQYGTCRVRLIGVIEPDEDKRYTKDEVGGVAWSDMHRRGTYYDTLDALLDGWADPDISGHDLAWITRKLAAAGRG